MAHQLLLPPSADPLDITGCPLTDNGVQECNRGHRQAGMERTLTLRSAVGLIVGIVIGSGIFASPGFVVAEVKSPGATLIVWSICGLVTLLGSLSMAELSAAIPMSGGESVYLTRAFHPVVGFWYTWLTGTLAKPAGAAAIAIVFSDYVCRLKWGEEPPEWDRKGITLTAVFFLASVQIVSTFAATVVQDFFAVEKLALIFTLCIAGIANAASPNGLADGAYDELGANATSAARHNLDPDRAFQDTSNEPEDWALALMNCLFAMNGWNNINLSAGEVKRPELVIPRAALISIPLITACYVWLNAAYLLTLTVDEMSGAKTIAVDFAHRIGGPIAGTATAVAVALSAFGALNGSMFGASRLVHACGKDGTLPSIFGWEARIGGRKTPLVGLLTQVTVITILVTVVGSFQVIVRVYIFAQWLFYLLTIVGLLRLRWTTPDLIRPFRVPTVAPIVFVGAAAFVCGVLLWQSPVECGVSIGVLALGTPLYLLQRRRIGTTEIQGDDEITESQPLLGGVSTDV